MLSFLLHQKGYTTSWDSYIDNLLAHCGAENADKACIIGQDGSMWTTAGHSQNLNISAQEAAEIGQCFKNKDYTPLQASGIHCEGVKYQFLRSENDKVVLGKKKDQGAITLQATKTAIVVAHTSEGGQQGSTNKGVNVIAEYIESLGM